MARLLAPRGAPPHRGPSCLLGASAASPLVRQSAQLSMCGLPSRGRDDRPQARFVLPAIRGGSGTQRRPPEIGRGLRPAAGLRLVTAVAAIRSSSGDARRAGEPEQGRARASPVVASIRATHQFDCPDGPRHKVAAAFSRCWAGPQWQQLAVAGYPGSERAGCRFHDGPLRSVYVRPAVLE